MAPQDPSVGDRQAAITVVTFGSLENCVFFIEPTMFAPSLPPVHNANKEEMCPVPKTGFSYLVHKFQNSGGMILEFAFPLLLLFTVPHSVKHRRKTTFPLDLVCLALPSCVTPISHEDRSPALV